MKLGEITDAYGRKDEKLKNIVLKYQRSKVTFFSYSLSFSLSYHLKEHQKGFKMASGLNLCNKNYKSYSP